MVTTTGRFRLTYWQGWLFVRFEIANEHERTVREHTCSRTTYPYTATEQNEQFANTNLFANNREQARWGENKRPGRGFS